LGKRKIGWRHVWKNFALTQAGHRLVDRTARLSDLGLQSGSELSFARIKKSKRQAVI
jgi:hypothetical protein